MSQGDNGRVVAKKSHYCSQSGHTRQVVKRLHQRTQQVLQQTHHTKLGEQLTDGSHQHTDGHDVEYGLKQQVVGRLHEGVQHLGQRHLIGQEPEEGEEDDEENEGFHASFGGEPQRFFQFLFNLFEQFLHFIMIKSGGSLDGVVFCLCHSGLFFLEVEKVDFPSETKVGLELADAVYAGV